MPMHDWTRVDAGIFHAFHHDWITELADLGYTDVWSSEANGTDGFTPLALAAAWAPTLRLGTAVVPVYTRGPALLAMTAAAMAEAAPGRFVLGLGTSSDVIVERWNDTPFDEPYKRVRDTVRFLKKALAGEKVDEAYDTFKVKGFKLGRPLAPEAVPPIVIGALRPGMLRLAGREADGAVINWLSAEDVRTVVPEVGAGKEIVARIFVCPSTPIISLGPILAVPGIRPALAARRNAGAASGSSSTPKRRRTAWMSSGDAGRKASASVPWAITSTSDGSTSWNRRRSSRVAVARTMGMTTFALANVLLAYAVKDQGER